jgi:hypothetical protein
MRLAYLMCSVCVLGCGGAPTSPDGPGNKPADGGIDVPGHAPGTPGVGAHGLSFYHLADPNQSDTTKSISTPRLVTQASGSAIIVSIGRGDNTRFGSAAAPVLPTDSRGNAPYQQLDTMHPYEPLYPESGTAAYAFIGARGGTDFQVTAATGQNAKGQLDEITIAAVEVVDANRIVPARWREVTSPPLTSASVTTGGPATLVAFWWGDGFPGTPQSATPDSGFTLIDSNTSATNSFVQCAVAVRNVTDAGTYSLTWTATPEQGAQMWLIAVE